MNPNLAECPQPAIGYDHVGIRVSNRRRSLNFYARLGFRETYKIPSGEANEMVTQAGVRINLIFNGAQRSGRRNVLLDEPVKLPGVTHPAFLVADIEQFQAWLGKEGVKITEGPKRIGPRRVALFIRDPDGNVLEFNQLIPGEGTDDDTL
ncbi:VOC family protein [Bowmanella dokdonensis]|uniref:VOC family protein n=1 Tax=Bowmanella dokdonensis TaxID=751969 RepID=A0A939DRR0_9ALTE|nr:VOC family protein [Bowmanella dokdonensis]MBN7827764.1 VOC family protein [Bowmanella dokdonensis]